MVRIVNGEIVHDDKPTSQRYGQPQPAATSGLHSPFPTTEGRFGMLSEKYQVLNVESELIWAVLFVFIAVMFGLGFALLFLALLALYHNNSIRPKTNVNRLSGAT